MQCGHFVFDTLVTRIIRPIRMIQNIEYGSILEGLVKLAHLGRLFDEVLDSCFTNY